MMTRPEAKLVMVFSATVLFIVGATWEPFASRALAQGDGGGTIVAKGDWPQFRGPGGLGRATAKGLVTNWSSDENLLWKTKLPGAGSSSPITIGNRIFLTCYTGYAVPGEPGGDISQLTRHLLCLNGDDGKILWTKDVPAKLPEQARVRDHGYAASTPAVDGERVYVFFGKSGVFAFNHDGRQLWNADVGSRVHGWGSAASPVLYRDLVIINASVESQSLIALNKRTGEEVWRAGGIRESWNTPVLVNVPGGRDELVVAIFGKVLGFDPQTGQLLWTCDTGVQSYICPSVVSHGGVVYALLRTASAAIRAGGRGDVTQSHLLWKISQGANVPSPVYHDGHIYFVREDGTVYCVDAETGRAVYSEQLTPRLGRVYSSPVLAGGKLYGVSRGGRAFVVAARPAFEQLAVNNMRDGSTFDASPVVTGSRLLIRSHRFLYCVGQK